VAINKTQPQHSRFPRRREWNGMGYLPFPRRRESCFHKAVS